MNKPNKVIRGKRALVYTKARFLFMCARLGTNLASESLATGIYRQV